MAQQLLLVHPVEHIPSSLNVCPLGHEEQLFIEVQVKQLGEQVRQYGLDKIVIYYV